MSNTYSELFISELSKRLNDVATVAPARPVYNKMLSDKRTGKPANIGVDLELLKNLSVKELCSDDMIADLLNLNTETVKTMREIYGLSDQIIPVLYTKYVTQQIAIDLEKELGELAFQLEVN